MFTPVPNFPDEVNQLREDATQTAKDIIEGINENLVFREDFQNFSNDVNNRLNEIMSVLTNMNNNQTAQNEDEQPLLHTNYDRIATPRPTVFRDDESTSTRFDLDHDVIMRGRFATPITQVPDPGMFSGKTSDTDLFCQLCEDTFKTLPNRTLPEETKINFVQSRLRDAARNWYLAKYKDNIYPSTMQELLDGLRIAFSNVASYKIAKIKIMRLKQQYGKINDYIEEFRSLSQQFKWNEEALSLIFYNGLHPKYQEEIEKMEVFPTTMESIITRCILIESSLSTKNKINQSSNSKSNKKRNSHFNHHRSYNNNNNNNNNNFQKYNNNYNNNNYKAQKISSKN